MAAKKRTVRARTEARQLSRERDKLYDARSKLALLEPGGRPENPIVVSSASVIEGRAAAEPCLRCQGPVRCAEHTTVDTAHGLVRALQLECPSCGTERQLYFRILAKTLH